MSAPSPEALADRASAQDGRLFFHANAVALDGTGALILGPSGSGKSSLSLALMALGAELISDDGVWLDGLTLRRPDTAPALIEARGIGLLNTGPIRDAAPLHLVIDLSRAEPDRLPPRRMATVAGASVELILAAEQTTLAPAIVQLLRFGRSTV